MQKVVDKYVVDFPAEDGEEEEDEDVEGSDEEVAGAHSAPLSCPWRFALLVCPVLSGDDEESFGKKMENAFLRAMGKGPKELVHVDMQQKLLDAGLLIHFPSSVWPPTNAVRETATRLRKLSKSGLTGAFVAADLRK